MLAHLQRKGVVIVTHKQDTLVLAYALLKLKPSIRALNNNLKEKLRASCNFLAKGLFYWK